MITASERRRADHIRTADEARLRARRRVPSTVFDYIDGGAGSESTVHANRHALEALPVIPRLGVTRGSPPPALETSVLGKPISFPVMLSPVGFARMMHPAGDLAAAAAASDAGIVHTLSTFSGHTLEEVARVATGRRWFQLYFLGGRGGAEALIDRAAAAGYEALVVTLDTQTGAMRERDVRHGVRLPLRIDLDNVLRFAPEAAVRPGWLLGFAQDRFHMDLANAAASTRAGETALDEALRDLRGSPPLWEDFRWIRDRWPGPVLAKGVLSADDARRAVDAGVAGIIVSNHGGRQLDGAPPTIGVLPEVVAAAGTDAEVFVDGGFRRGADVVRALSLGARAVMVGRPWAFGLAAAGEAGIAKVLELLRADVERVLRLIGCPSVGELGPGYLGRPDASLTTARPRLTDDALTTP